ncbi:MAG: TPM domain-containing protein [Crocinitomicaceae bacterium]
MKSSPTSVISNRISVFLLSLFLTVTGTLSFAQDTLNQDTLTATSDSLQLEEEVPTSIFEAYYAPISTEEAEKNYAAINTAGVIDQYANVPNMREINNSDVSDPHNMLSSIAIDTINAIIQQLEQETGYEMAVVCLNSIGDNDPHLFATDLFNHWGIGKKGADNGVLIMVVNDIHKVSTITGRGTEAVLTDAQTSEIHEEEMIPYFKKQDYVTGVVRGVQAVADVLYGVPTAYSQSYNASDYSTNNTANYDLNWEDDYEYKWYNTGFVHLYILLTIALTAAYLLLLLGSFMTKNLHRRYHLIKTFTLLIFPILFPIPFLILYFINKSLMNKWRNTERFSEETGEFMIKMDENSDDKHLKKGQITEEQVKSIDYDVWVTLDGSDVLILKYKKWFSKYNKCPKCKYKTYFKEYDRIISSATYSSSGTGEKKYSCKNCGHSKIKRYTIPRKTRSSSSSSGGGYSSSSSSSSSSGSSYGGGSSRGGGSTSGW